MSFPVVPVLLGAGVLGAIALLNKRDLNAIPPGPVGPGTPVVPAAFPNLDPTAATALAQKLNAANAAEATQKGQLSPAQLAAIEAAQPVDPGLAQAMATEDGDLTINPPLKAGDIFPSDHVTISVARSGLNLPGVVKGNFMIRATRFNDAANVFGIIIDPRFPSDPAEHSFPLNAVTGVAPVG